MLIESSFCKQQHADLPNVKAIQLGVVLQPPKQKKKKGKGQKMSSLGDPMDSPLRETAGHSNSTTPVASGTAAMLPPRNNRSTAWDHFTVESGVEKKASRP
ncbi:HAT family dimerization domain-containing protein [Sesbania bispinosa]|nr:HAT family dimerization domain-containing protein [Sesbania bispinosa]